MVDVTKTARPSTGATANEEGRCFFGVTLKAIGALSLFTDSGQVGLIEKGACLIKVGVGGQWPMQPAREPADTPLGIFREFGHAGFRSGIKRHFTSVVGSGSAGQLQ